MRKIESQWLLNKFEIEKKITEFDGEVKFPIPLKPETKDFIRSCLKVNPNERLSVRRLLEHPFLNKKASKSSLSQFLCKITKTSKTDEIKSQNKKDIQVPHVLPFNTALGKSNFATLVNDNREEHNSIEKVDQKSISDLDNKSTKSPKIQAVFNLTFTDTNKHFFVNRIQIFEINGIEFFFKVRYLMILFV